MARIAGIFAVTLGLCFLPLTQVMAGSERPVTVEPRQIFADPAQVVPVPVQPDAADSLVFNAVWRELLGDQPFE